MVHSPLEKKGGKKSLVWLIVGGVTGETEAPHISLVSQLITKRASPSHPHHEGPQGLIHPRFPRVLGSSLSMC